MQLHAHIFKAYDIRGLTPVSLNAEVAFALGKAFGTHARSLGESVLAVGRDGRLSGPMLHEALIDGLVWSGMQVLDVGLVTTPMLYFAAHTLCNSGIQITGSHNPRDYNGFKMVLGGRAIHGDEILALERIMRNESAQAVDGGAVRRVDIFEAYRSRIVSDIALARPLKIVLDSGNGVAGATAPEIFRSIGCEVVELYSQVDGNFPNHHPDPGKLENLQDLVNTLRCTDAEIGLAFDGDGDRLGIVTREGNIVFPDRQIMLFAQDVLSRVPGAHIVFDVKCSQQLADSIRDAGGEPLMFKTGHSLIKAKMREINASVVRADAAAQAALGGEMSGHIFFQERWFGFDDGTYAGCRLLEILSKSPDASAVLNALPTSFVTPEINVACQEGEAQEVVERLLAMVHGERDFQDASLTSIDGLRVDWKDGFGLIRASNTTPVLVLRFEGQTQAALERIERSMVGLLQRVKPDAVLGAPSH